MKKIYKMLLLIGYKVNKYNPGYEIFRLINRQCGDGGNMANVKLWLKHLTKRLYGCNFVAILS